MKSIVESIKDNLNEAKSELYYTLTWDLEDLMDKKTIEDAYEYLYDEISEDDDDKDQVNFYIELRDMINKYDGHVHTFNGGNLYPDTTMRDLLIELGAIEKDEWGAVLNQDGDCETSTLIVFRKKMNPKDKKRFAEMIEEYDKCSNMMIAEIF